MDFFTAIILGIIEGLTEFLPVSSTGHMILAAKFLGLEQDGNDTLKCFEIVIQLGSILAVFAMFVKRLVKDYNLILKLIVGFVPTAIVGFLAYKHIKKLFDPSVVAYALIVGGVIFILVEIFQKHKSSGKISTTNDNDEISLISYKQAFLIGLGQILAMIPGTSRSGATIVTGLLCGLSRTAAAAFSFLLALPTMFAAVFYEIFKSREIFIQNTNNILIFLLGGIIAFVVAFAVLKIFLDFISRFSYISFGIYRIIVGIIFLIFIL